MLFGAASLFTSHATAGPSVNVALQTSFNAAPYLVELLYVSLLRGRGPSRLLRDGVSVLS